MKLISILYVLLLSSSYSFSHSLFSNFSNKCKNVLENEVSNNRKNNANFLISPGFEVKYYRCHWETDPAIRYISGDITAYISFTKTMNEISFDLRQSLNVDSVKHKNEILTYFQRNDSLIIRLPSEAKPGDMDSVTIFYQGTPANSGFGTYANGSEAGRPVMWTQSEPFGSRDWWPCHNGLEDKADSIDIYITTPAEFTAVSNGIRQSVTIVGDKKTTHWKHRYPIASYLVCMAVAHYEEFSETFKIGQDSLYMQTFCYPASLSLFKEKTPLIYETFKYFTDLVGQYPFINEKYGHTQFGWGGGMEHQTNTFISTPDESLMAHELAHQWFGNKVTAGSWNHIWLSEGFATLLASMDMERKYPGTIRETRKKEMNTITSLPDGSVYIEGTPSESRIFNSRLSYSKGARVLNTLRWILGDSLFFKGINDYLADKTLMYGFATTADLQRNMEKASGKDLGYFFRDWVYGQGYPSYKVQWSQVGSDYVNIKMNQVTSDISVPFFSLPVPLLFKNSTQQKTLVVNNSFNGETFFEKIGFVADTILIDPDYWLITKNNLSEKINNTSGPKDEVLVYPNPVRHSLYVYLKNSQAKTVSLKLFDATGKILLQDKMDFAGMAAYKEFNLQKFPGGTYFMHLWTDKNLKVVKKIIKN